MSSFVSRLALDLRQVRGWVIAMGAAAFVVAAVSTYSVPFAVQAADVGTLSPQAPREPLSFLRVIDPNASIVIMIDADYVPTLETPGISVLLEQLNQYPDAFVALPLRMFTDRQSPLSGDRDQFSRTADNGLVVLGFAPPFLESGSRPGGPILLWGTIAGQTPEIDDTRLGSHPVQQLSVVSTDREYIAGTGRIARTEGQPVLAMSVSTARGLGVGISDLPADFVSGVTCYCPASELSAVASAMTAAEQGAGTGRVYYAVEYQGLIGPIERSRAAAAVLTAALPLATLLGLCCVVVVGARLIWTRRAHAYLVEWVCGAGETALQIRSQILIALSLTFPAMAGFLLLDIVQRFFGASPPWPQCGGPLLLVAAAGLQLVAGIETAIRVHQLCRHTQAEKQYA